ncbi:hypothetical protein R1flu_021498 [Riccia fluitans]|uniref:Uncharacterized protein n=1 Tax=Riccia fluitans TaxID=41844 RepID=A0ABD1ZPI8_9MARC
MGEEEDEDDKEGMIDLSSGEEQEAKRKEETNYAKGTLQAPETDIIDNFRKSMPYGEEGNWKEEKLKLQMEAWKATSDKIQAKIEIE